jgi:diguanylate cyclase (GGDEF)-like protein
MIGVGFAILGDLWTSTAKSEQLSGIIGASTMAGSAARSFSARIRTGRDEEAMTSGLLPYVGELALLRRFPDEFVEAWTSQGGLPTLEHQRETMGVDGARVGEALMGSWPIPEDLCDGVRARSQPLADRLRRTPNVFDAALGFGTAISGLLAARSESALEAIRPFARDWGLSDDDLMTYWAEFRVAARRTDHQLGVKVGADLDAAITAARDEYMASPIQAQDQLDSAQREIDELRTENERLEGLSLRDPLTGIPNRPAFENHLRGSLAALKRREAERPVAVALFDVDHFKQVNDRLGHFVGDELLQAIATAGDDAVRTEELFARLGGDEFAMVLRPVSMDELEAAVDRVREAMVAAAVETVEGNATTVSAGPRS